MSRLRHRLLIVTLQLALGIAAPFAAQAAGPGKAAETKTAPDARALMQAAVRRHQHDPFVYEEQTLILIDAAGHRSVRKARFFLRAEAGGRTRMLLVFDDPEEVRGVALLAERSAGRMTKSGVFLPALSADMVLGSADARGSRFLGTDFAIEDLVAETTADWNYLLEGERVVGGVTHLIVRATP
ncbi:MAG: outer membrane lipoprotein-sorting protein, partial [Proteobacteria bacterium]|nr:outer membrane lipoprotein-sorting protein [Pseudomonadota bacterium]